MKVRCAHCKQWTEKERGHVNRSRKVGMKFFCDHRCFGLARRTYKPKAQKVEEKRLYDAEYRRKNRARLRAEKRAYFQRTYDPVKAAIERKASMARHVAYCRRPEYKRWKKRYDQRFRAKKFFGPYAEAFLLLQKIEHEVSNRITNYEVRQINGTLNKTLQRKRAYARLVGNQFKDGPVGNPAGHQKRQDAACAGRRDRGSSARDSAHGEGSTAGRSSHEAQRPRRGDRLRGEAGRNLSHRT